MSKESPRKLLIENAPLSEKPGSVKQTLLRYLKEIHGANEIFQNKVEINVAQTRSDEKLPDCIWKLINNYAELSAVRLPSRTEMDSHVNLTFNDSHGQDLRQPSLEVTFNDNLDPIFIYLSYPAGESTIINTYPLIRYTVGIDMKEHDATLRTRRYKSDEDLFPDFIPDDSTKSIERLKEIAASLP